MLKYLPVPFSCLIKKEQRLVVVTGSESFTYADLKTIQRQLRDDPAFDPTFDLLTDLTQVTSFDISSTEAATIAYNPVFSPQSRRATVATQPSVFGIGRMMQAHREALNLQGQACVFYDLDSALKWLGIEDQS